MRSMLRLALAAAAAGSAACSSDGPTASGRPATPAADLPGHAFQLTIDTRSGKIDVAPPHGATAAPTEAVQPSLSLIGSDGVQMTADRCTFTPVPNNPRQQRCTFLLEIENRLAATDLVSPTGFPRPPAGTAGVLVFPFTASASGSLAPTAVPSPDWDAGPTNFFNDDGGCSSGKKSDCYRYEVFASPLYARETNVRTVGFDVPIDATSVTAYIVVAADLRDNPVRTARLATTNALCGTVSDLGEVVSGDDAFLIGARLVADEIRIYRSFCSFRNTLPPVDLLIRSAVLTISTARRSDLDAEPRVEYLPYGTTLDEGDYGLTAIGTSREMPRSPLDDYYWIFEGSVISGVQQASDERATDFPFRFRAKNEEDTFLAFAGTTDFNGPDLVVTYTLR